MTPRRTKRTQERTRTVNDSSRPEQPTSPAPGQADRVREPHAPYTISTDDLMGRLVAALESDPALRIRVAGLLGVPVGLPEALGRLTDELREQRLAAERRFETMDRRFEELRSDMNARLGEMNGILSATLLQVGRFTRRTGHRVEDLVATTLCFALRRPDIRPDQVRLRQLFVDVEGRSGRKGRKVEMDVVAADGRTYLMEVRSTTKPGDVEFLAERAEFVAGMMGLAPDSFDKVLVTFEKSDELVEACREAGMILI